VLELQDFPQTTSPPFVLPDGQKLSTHVESKHSLLQFIFTISLLSAHEHFVAFSFVQSFHLKWLGTCRNYAYHGKTINFVGGM